MKTTGKYPIETLLALREHGLSYREIGRRPDCPLKLVEGKDEQTNVKCRYCNSESVEIIARGTESILYKCKACKMEFAKLNIKEVEP